MIVLVNDEEWTSRSLESILTPEGYAVAVVHSGRQALDLATRARPDLFIIDDRLPDMNGSELCARLRALPDVRSTTPILLLASDALPRSECLEAYRLGAWGVLQPPFDRQELLARLAPYIRAKQDTDEALEETDSSTGCYNVRGLMRRLVEIRADARRTRRLMACVVAGPLSSSTTTDALERAGHSMFADRLAMHLRTVTRASDAVARIGQDDFVVLAPGTGPDGGARLVERIESVEGSGGRIAVRAGLFAAAESAASAPHPDDFLRRATLALRMARDARTTP